ncbi:MAG: DNA (cytosine-5-)-methyltransferase [Atopobiaceae bacterium]|nr:DNA (cytosine-5-)-methyltransferase [Atopobiaceae bacterium]
MRYISLFSGIEAATVAWEPLGWEPVAFSEIEPYCCRLLAERYPDVPNLGDITKIEWEEVKREYGTVDVVVGGSPCQSFSVAGKREGLRGQSGLMYEFIRAVQELRPRWFIWENVPGALSVERGQAFRQLLGEMADLGYGLAWRVLDAQFFDVAQRRERVFLVGSLGDMSSAEILFDEEGLRRDYQTGRAKRQAITADLEAGLGGVHSYTLKLRHTGTPNIGGGAGALMQTEASGTIGTSQDQTLFQNGCLTPWDGQAVRVFNPYGEDAAPALNAAAAETGTPSKTIIQQSPTYCIQGKVIGRKDKDAPNGSGVNEEVCFTQNTVDVHCVAQQVYSKQHRSMSATDATTYVPSECANTLNTFDVGESRANEIVCMTDTQPNTCIVAGGGALGALTQRMYKDPPVCCFQTSGRSSEPYAQRTAREESQDSPGRRGKSSARSIPSSICVGSDAGKSSVDDDLCGTLHVGGVRRSL